MNDMDSNALNRVLSASDLSGDASAAAKQHLRNISKNKAALGLRDEDILEALGEPHAMLSGAGAYYRIQHYIVTVIGTLGGAMIALFGVAAVAWAIKKGSTLVLAAMSKAVRTVASIVKLGVPGQQVDAFLGLFAAHDGEDNSSSLMLGLLSLIPGPYGMVANTFIDSLDVLGTPPTNRPPTGAQSRGLASIDTPLPSAAAPSAIAAPAPKPAAPTDNTAAEVAAYTQTAATLVSAIAGLVDADVRDGETRDDDTAAILTAAALSFGIPRDELFARARAYAESTSEGSSAQDGDFESLQRLASPSLQ